MKRRALTLLLALLLLANGGTAFASGISYVKMSGIPGTMIRVGQTCSLTAVVYYLDGSHSFEEAISWASSNPNVAKIDQFGNLVSLRKGTTVISVTTAASGPNGLPASDLATLSVTESWSYSNIHPDVWSKLGYYNANMDRYDERLNFLDVDPAKVGTASFQSDFRSRYGVSPSQVTDLPDADTVAFDSRSSWGGGRLALKPSMEISVAALAKTGGSLLPVEFTYNLSWKEVGDILGRNVTSIQDGREIFEKINIVFENTAGGTYIVVDENSAPRMLSSNVLQIANGNNGLTLTLKAMIADVKVADGTALIEDALIVPDGVADGTSGGSMWLVKKTGNGGVDSGSTGGGCDAGLGIWAITAGLALTRKIKKTIGR